MKDLTPQQASARIQDWLEGRGWWLATPFPTRLVREILRTGGVPDPGRLAASVPSAFLTSNNISRVDVQQVLAWALDGYRVVGTTSAVPVTNIYNGKVENVAKKTEINNSGQWAGNVDSPNSTTNVERQQQVYTPAEEQAVRAHLDDPQVREALALDLPAEEKAPLVGGRLARIANVGKDIATDVAAKVIAEMAKSQMGG